MGGFGTRLAAAELVEERAAVMLAGTRAARLSAKGLVPSPAAVAARNLGAGPARLSAATEAKAFLGAGGELLHLIFFPAMVL